MARRGDSRYDNNDKHSLVDSLNDVPAAKFYAIAGAGTGLLATILTVTGIAFFTEEPENCDSLQEGIDATITQYNKWVKKENKEQKAYLSWIGKQRVEEFKGYRIKEDSIAVRVITREQGADTAPDISFEFHDTRYNIFLRMPVPERPCNMNFISDGVVIECGNKKKTIANTAGKGVDDRRRRIFNAYVEMYGDPIQKAKDIAHRMTKKRLPLTLQMKYVDSFKERLKDGTQKVGDHNFIDSKIRVLKTNSYISVLATALHEIGHAIYMGNEISDQSPGNDVFEEAAAYAFMVAGLVEYAKMHPENQDVAKLDISLRNLGHMIDYRNGSEEEHDRGWATTRTIAEHFNGDYAKAFNYLLDKQKWEDLDTRMLSSLKKERQKQNRTLLAQRKFYDRPLTKHAKHSKKNQQIYTPNPRKQHQYQKR